jgi:hypothetical protein
VAVDNTNKDYVAELYSLVKELEISDKVQDERINTLIGITKETLENIKEHSRNFKIHDEKEMKKYEENDKHIVNLTNSVDLVASTIKNIDSTLEKHERMITENKRESDENFKDIIGKQNKFLGGIAVLIFVFGILGGVINYIQETNSKAEVEKEQLRNEIKKLEIYNNRNDAILKYNKGNQ